MPSAILFCPRSKAKALSEATGIRLMHARTYTGDLAHLREGNPIIVSEVHVTLGWVAPPDCVCEYIEGFPTSGPTRIQADARFLRSSHRCAPHDNDLIVDSALSTRTKNVLKNLGFLKFGDLKNLSKHRFLLTLHAGRTCLGELESYLKRPLTDVVFEEREGESNSDRLARRKAWLVDN